MNVAIVGYGNIGRAVLEAVNAAPDMCLAGVVLRDRSAAGQKGVPAGVPVAQDIAELQDKGPVSVAALCAPSRAVPALAEALLTRGISTVDSYDIHGDIYDRRQQLDKAAKAGKAVSILAAGWDPGSDSVVRALLEAAAPKGITYTNFGPGMSMGHTAAVHAIPGVKKALSMTIPVGTGIHRRMVYVELHDSGQFDEVSARIKADPYFVHDETFVMLADDVDALMDKGHAVHLTRKGVSGATDNQLFTFDMAINNPALTGQILVSSARAAARQAPGCYTLPEIPPIDLLPGDRETLIRRLV